MGFFNRHATTSQPDTTDSTPEASQVDKKDIEILQERFNTDLLPEDFADREPNSGAQIEDFSEKIIEVSGLESRLELLNDDKSKLEIRNDIVDGIMSLRKWSIVELAGQWGFLKQKKSTMTPEEIEQIGNDLLLDPSFLDALNVNTEKAIDLIIQKPAIPVMILATQVELPLENKLELLFRVITGSLYKGIHFVKDKLTPGDNPHNYAMVDEDGNIVLGVNGMYNPREYVHEAVSNIIFENQMLSLDKDPKTPEEMKAFKNEKQVQEALNTVRIIDLLTIKPTEENGRPDLLSIIFPEINWDAVAKYAPSMRVG